jgi:citrate lyase subunit beta / citryl-CoA lyase
MQLCPRSMLFVSGEKVERFAKAFATDADLVCIDLEDAVHPGRKAEARAQVFAWLAATPPAAGSPARAVRINSLQTRDALRDVLALVESGIRLDALLVPKVENAADVQMVHRWLGDQAGSVIALLETPEAIERASEIARAGPMLGALMLGGADLAAELNAQFGWDGLLYARGRIVNAARAAGVQAWDVPHIDLADSAGLAEETRRVLALGFDCKTAIHPQQLPGIHAAFVPAPAELEWAQTLLAAVPAGGASGAFLFQGRMVDAPLLRKAQRTVERARRAGRA